MFEHAMSNTGSEHTENVLQNFYMLKQKAEKMLHLFAPMVGGWGLHQREGGGVAVPCFCRFFDTYIKSRLIADCRGRAAATKKHLG